ncbi:hypothetical protein CMV_021987 [Castanea mollissima]|uniref:Uncharacterized protein n=1 Tax=Castanea mollissima TaxID=60419 RepID=A0A8J4QEP2_9ROSI|nr:hypothetical protein CMV_021987 [Castanea mollissima]
MTSQFSDPQADIVRARPLWFILHISSLQNRKAAYILSGCSKRVLLILPPLRRNSHEPDFTILQSMETMCQRNSPHLASGFPSFCILFALGNTNCQSYCQWRSHILLLYSCGSLLSIYGCYHYHLLSSRDLNVHLVETDVEQGPYVPLTLTYREATNLSKARRISDPQGNNHVFQAAGILSYVFEVLFQMNAGAVVLTDSVYWCIIFPFLTIQDYNLNVMTLNMHTLNAVLLLGDTALNCLRVPLYRISFFVIWTGVYVIVQWIIHACVSIWWPYPFLDLSSPYAPLWYLLIASMHIPCYGVFSLIVELKHYLLSKRFPQSYQCQRKESISA